MLVSVLMITYNHEKYVSKALEGVLKQRCNFDFEVILANDNATDSSDLLIKNYVSNHPKGFRVKYTNHKKNKGMQDNFIWAAKQCRGKYIALCEGDDYWTDPLKLQKQVDFLEKHSDYNICFHNVKLYDERSKLLQADNITRKVSETTTIQDMAKGNYIHTPSVVFRNNIKIPKWFSKVFIGDWTLYMLAIGDGKIRKLNEEMAVYRLHAESVWSNKTQEARSTQTKETIAIVYKHQKKALPKPVKNILKSRLGISDSPTKKFVKKLLKKLKIT